MQGGIEFVSSCVPHIATIFPCNKAGRVKIRHLGFVQTILQLYSDLPIGRGSNPLPSTIQYLRRILFSVTLLADTYKTWCSHTESNCILRLTKPVHRHQCFKSVIGCGRCIRNTWAELMRLTDRLNARNIRTGYCLLFTAKSEIFGLL
jgi:hypothetical protein